MVEEIGPEEVAALLDGVNGGRRKAVLLDVREPWERAHARIEPSLHIPMNDVPDRVEELPRDQPLIVYCHHGGRSEAVAGFLESQGFARVINLRGGIDAWSVTVDPAVPRYG